LHSPAPIPPQEFIFRVGGPPGEWGPIQYDELGAVQKAAILEILPPDWSFEGRRMLDFGSGAGRLLRHFFAEAEAGGEFYGCDVDPEMIAWMDENLCPPLSGALATNIEPPLPFPDSHFDLVTAISVFTHITTYWAEWILEMQRITKPGGFVLATILGDAMSRDLTPVPWDEDATAMNCFGFGPHVWRFALVLHSEWWIRTHWGRAFDINAVQLNGFASEPDSGHGVVLMSPKDVSLSVADLQRYEPGEERYSKAWIQNLRQLDVDGDMLRERGGQLDTILNSRSWKLTAPLRALGRLARRDDSRQT
jgi:SAM-dependent methyltransferase